MTEREATDTFQRLFDAYVEGYMAGDAQACAAFYAEDGEIHSPFGPPIVGRANIQTAHDAWFLDGEFDKTITILDARAEGNIGFALARYGAYVPRQNGGYDRDEGSSLNSFERGPDGRWLIRHTSLNAKVDEH